MKIEHIAIWTNKLEEMRAFYERFFSGKSGGKYRNEKKGFESYFLEFDSGARLELMRRSDITGNIPEETIGLAHFAFSTGSKAKVKEYTQLLVEEGYTCLDGPRETGDGYYESVIADPDGNRVEITI